MEMVKCDGPDCKEETPKADWKSRLKWAQVTLELFVSGEPDGDEETTANAARRRVGLNFHNNECWQNWRRNGEPIDWPEHPTKQAAGSQLLQTNRSSTLSPGEFDRGEIVNPETF